MSTQNKASYELEAQINAHLKSIPADRRPESPSRRRIQSVAYSSRGGFEANADPARPNQGQMQPTKKPADDKPKRGRPWPDGRRGRKRPLLASSSVAQETADGIQAEMDAQCKPRGHIIDAMWAAYKVAARSKISQLEHRISQTLTRHE